METETPVKVAVPTWVSLVAGGVAGTAVDVFLFPLDTIKTRLQSKRGFRASGGLRKIYAGIGPAAVGSAPNAAFFFAAYDTVKTRMEDQRTVADPVGHMFAAAVGEIVACIVRVPVEVVKQRRQSDSKLTTKDVLRFVFKSHGFAGFYRGYLTTVTREIPFSFIQFPLWEALKRGYASSSSSSFDGSKNELNLEIKEVSPFISASLGSVAGGIAAAVTNPLDVAKTRIMLSNNKNYSTFGILSTVYREKGFPGLFAGVIPRVTWISIGGFIFFGAYEQVKHYLIS